MSLISTKCPLLNRFTALAVGNSERPSIQFRTFFLNSIDSSQSTFTSQHPHWYGRQLHRHQHPDADQQRQRNLAVPIGLRFGAWRRVDFTSERELHSRYCPFRDRRIPVPGAWVPPRPLLPMHTSGSSSSSQSIELLHWQLAAPRASGRRNQPVFRDSLADFAIGESHISDHPSLRFDISDLEPVVQRQPYGSHFGSTSSFCPCANYQLRSHSSSLCHSSSHFYSTSCACPFSVSHSCRFSRSSPSQPA